jgi:hypothetical protein
VRRKLSTTWALAALIAAQTFLPPAALARTRQAAAQAATAANLNEVTAEQMKAYLTFVASDEMEGRNTPSRGLDITAKFLAALLARAGVAPAGDDGTYFQKIMLRRDKIDAEKSRVEVGGQQFKFGDGFLAQPVAGSVAGNVVYVGHGWVVPAKGLDAYKTAAGRLDVKDKIVVTLGGVPAGVAVEDVMNGKQGVDWDNALSYAAKNGAKAVIVAPSPQALSAWKRLRDRAQKGGAFMVEKLHTPELSRVPTVTASESLLAALFQGEQASGADILGKTSKDKDAGAPVAPFELSPGKKVTINVAAQVEQVPTQNVVAKIEGSDPQLKHEYVAVGAHYDHVGVGNPVNGDAIFNGADDDGSGTVAVLAMAEALAKGPRPKRSFLFVWHCGEEKGLWGSEYFVEHPTVPLGQIVAQFNIDMIGRGRKPGDGNSQNAGLSGPEEIYVIGSKMMSTELGQISEAVNNSYLKLKFNYKYDDPKDSERLFYRSDHYNYAKKGIPIIFYFDGIHEDYHRPSDHVEKIDFQKMEKVTRTILATAWEVADRAGRVKVDKKLPAELTSR